MSDEIKKDAALAVAQGVLALVQYGFESDKVMAEIRSWPDSLTADEITLRFEKLSADAIAAAKAVQPPSV